MGAARDRRHVALPPGPALDLWLDASRWATFVDGFGNLDHQRGGWPSPGARSVWRSRPGGRGTVTEKVVELEPGERVVVDVLDDKLAGRQTAVFEPAEDGGAWVDVELDYKLTGAGGPLRVVADVVFIRRALRDSIRRTLSRFAVEAEEEAMLEGRSG